MVIKKYHVIDEKKGKPAKIKTTNKQTQPSKNKQTNENKVDIYILAKNPLLAK